MKSEELFLILASWFLGILAVGVDALFTKIGLLPYYNFSYYGFFAIVFFIFSIYFLLKFTGLLKYFKNHIFK